MHTNPNAFASPRAWSRIFYNWHIPNLIILDSQNATISSLHPGFAKCYDIISSSWYIRGLSKHLREYLRHCPDCQVFQTRRHKSYETLQPVLSSSVSFHTITIDFILTLSCTDESFDFVMSVICKFSKRVILILDKPSGKQRTDLWHYSPDSS